MLHLESDYWWNIKWCLPINYCKLCASNCIVIHDIGVCTPF